MTVKVDGHGLTVQAARPTLSQAVAYATASVLSKAMTVGTSLGQYTMDTGGNRTQTQPVTTQHVRLCATTDCYVRFGPTGTTVSSTNGMLLPALVPEYFWVLPGEFIAVIQSSTSGVLNITECTP